MCSLPGANRVEDCDSVSFCCCDDTPNKNNVKKEGLIVPTVWGYGPSWGGRHGGRGRERWMLALGLPSLFHRY